MPANDKLDAMLKQRQPGPLELRRGQGTLFSTNNPDANIEDVPPVTAPSPKPPQIARESAKVDKRLIKTYKMIAAQQDRNLYEVMEEALREWLEIHNSTNGKID